MLEHLTAVMAELSHDCVKNDKSIDKKFTFFSPYLSLRKEARQYNFLLQLQNKRESVSCYSIWGVELEMNRFHYF